MSATGAFLVAALSGTVALASHGATAPSVLFAANRFPAISGEIYRVDAGGRRVDLTNSPFYDSQPLVAPSGQTLAFVSDRAGYSAMYVVDLDGRGLRRVTPAVPSTDLDVPMVWAPDGKRVAVVVQTLSRAVVYVTKPEGLADVVYRSDYVASVAWSPDGRLLTVDRSNVTVALTARGKSVWKVAGGGGPGWSRSGLFAASTARDRIRVYDARGRPVFQIRARSATWSPDGQRLASLVGNQVEVRVGATGRLVLDKAILRPATGTGGRGTPNRLVWDGTARGTPRRVRSLCTPRTGKQLSTPPRRPAHTWCMSRAPTEAGPKRTPVSPGAPATGLPGCSSRPTAAHWSTRRNAASRSTTSTRSTPTAARSSGSPMSVPSRLIRSGRRTEA